MTGTLSRPGALILPLLLLFASLASAATVQPVTGLRQGFEHSLAYGTPIHRDPALYVISSLEGDELSADVYAVIGQSYERFRATLTEVDNWCEFVPVNLNIKSCVYDQRQGEGDTRISFYVGRKFYQPPEDAHILQYAFQVRMSRPDFLDILLYAEEGPLGTRGYRIHIQAMPYQGRTLVRFNTAYKQSLVSSLATKTYLNTLGRDKVGFTVVDHDEQGQPIYNRGIHAVIERNVMRNYLALKAYLETLDLPPQARYEARIQYWYDETMRYRTQLYELERDEYLAAKRREYQNQRQLQAGINQGITVSRK